jgi:hypothetical protein
MALVVGRGRPKAASDEALEGTPTRAPIATPSGTPTAIPDKPSVTPSASSVAGLSAVKILAKAQAAAKAATRVRMKGAVSDGKERMVLDVRVTKNGG